MPSFALEPALRRTARRALHDVRTWASTTSQLARWQADLRAFRRAERQLRLPRARVEPYLQLWDRTATTPFDPHYAVQGAWVMRLLLEHRPASHVDVGSHIDYLGFFAAATPTVFVDIRPAGLVLPALSELPGSVLALPFSDRAVPSISCLHVIEHVGLGRYGDSVDPAGLEKACAELARIVAPGGHLYLSTPIGRPRLCFNAHRVSSAVEIPSHVAGLRLKRFDVVDDGGRYLRDVALGHWEDQEYALGMYVFGRD